MRATRVVDYYTFLSLHTLPTRAFQAQPSCGDGEITVGCNTHAILHEAATIIVALNGASLIS